MCVSRTQSAISIFRRVADERLGSEFFPAPLDCAEPVPDIAYHVAIVAVLVWGPVVPKRALPDNARQDA